MKNLVKINNQNLAVKEYQGKRVVTFSDIDMVHGRPQGTAKRNFNSNQEHFIKGEDYYVAKPKDFQKYEIRTLGGNVPNRGIILITETGYLMLVKSFTDKLAWSVQRQLVKSYFRLQEIVRQEYKLQVKTFNGKPVMTYHDLEYLFGVSKELIYYHAKNNNIIQNILFGVNLRQFKRENRKTIPLSLSSVTIFTDDKVRKIAEILGKDLDLRFNEYFGQEERLEPGMEIVVDIKEPELKKQINDAKKYVITLETLLNNALVYRKEEEHKNYLNSISMISANLMMLLHDIKKLKVELIKIHL